MKKFILSLAAMTMSLMPSFARGTYQMGSNPFYVDTVFHTTIGPGMTTTAIRMSGGDSNTNSIKTSVYYTTIDLTNPNLEIRGVQASDKLGSVENVQSMGKRKNALGNGQYMAGVNSDFFNMSTDNSMLGRCMVDERVYRTAGWSYYESYALVPDKKDIVLDMGVTITGTMKFPDGKTHAFHIDEGRGENYLVVYTRNLGRTATGTNEYGRECSLKLISGTLEDHNAVFEVTSANVDYKGNMAVPSGGFVLSGHGSAFTLMGQLKVGDRLSLNGKYTVHYGGKELTAKQVIGGCTMLAQNGKMMDDSFYSSNILNHYAQNTARTAIGYDKDRTKLIILVVDSYTSNNSSSGYKATYSTSTGFVPRRVAQLMLNLGCYTAMSFDGGGSSQLYNKHSNTVNVPYGSSTFNRAVANGIFAVETTPVDNNVALLEVYQKNVKLSSGQTFTPTVYGYNKYGVLVSTNVTGFKFTVASSLGTVSGTTFKAGSAKGSTHGVVSLGDIKCAVRILTNGGGAYVTSGDDNAPLEVKAPYIPDQSLGTDSEPLKLTVRHSFVTDRYNDGYDSADPDWSSTDAIRSKSSPRYATGRNGVLYTLDMKTMSIAEITWDGTLKPLYKLPALTGVVDGVKDYYGAAISSDDKGNFLIGHYLTKPASYRVFTIYSPKSGKAKTFELPIPAGEKANGRIDNFGRVVGDLCSDAYVYVAPIATAVADQNHAHIIHFTGNGDIDNVTATSSFSNTMWMAGGGNSQSICQPAYSTVAQMKGIDINKTFYYYSKAAGVALYTCDLFTDGSNNYCLNWNNYSALNGFDTFVMGGKRYFVVAYSSESDYNNKNTNNQHIIVKNEAGETVGEWNNDKWTSDAGYNTITAVPVNDNLVNIYVYNCDGKHIGGALLSLTRGDYKEYEAKDITPDGLKFETYSDGDEFKITASPATPGNYSNPAWTWRDTNPNAFTKDGQLTVLLSRGNATIPLTQADIDNTYQRGFTIQDIPGAGKCLVVNQIWGPGENMGWPSADMRKVTTPQLSFFLDPSKITEKTGERHYVRVRLVFNNIYRGCHYNSQDAKLRQSVYSIYASHDGNYVLPTHDELLGARYAEDAASFALWVGETFNDNDIPENPSIYIPSPSDVDPWDAGHHVDGATNHNAVAPAYLSNGERFRVYEFDTYVDLPSTTAVQFNYNYTLHTNIFKEISFTDLGTDEASATLLGRRQIGWKYYKSTTSGIEDVTPDYDTEDVEAVYYNLQGIQVLNPEPGIYIVRRGNKVTKELVK